MAPRAAFCADNFADHVADSRKSVCERTFAELPAGAFRLAYFVSLDRNGRVSCAVSPPEKHRPAVTIVTMRRPDEIRRRSSEVIESFPEGSYRNRRQAARHAAFAGRPDRRAPRLPQHRPTPFSAGRRWRRPTAPPPTARSSRSSPCRRGVAVLRRQALRRRPRTPSARPRSPTARTSTSTCRRKASCSVSRGRVGRCPTCSSARHLFPAVSGWPQGAARRARGSRGPVSVNDASLVVHSGGHMGSFAGQAYLPEKLPAGVSGSDIK